jgi:hypothetical protein
VPETWQCEEDGIAKIVRIGRAQGRQAPMSRVLDEFDYTKLTER